MNARKAAAALRMLADALDDESVPTVDAPRAPREPALRRRGARLAPVEAVNDTDRAAAVSAMRRRGIA